MSRVKNVYHKCLLKILIMHMYVNNTVCCTAKWHLFISWWDSKEPATPTLDSCGSQSKNEGIYPGPKDMLPVEISLRGFIHSSTFCWNKFDLLLQMKQKIQTTKAVSFLSDDVSEITDEPLQSSSTTSQQESTPAQSRWKSDKHITKTEESLLDDLEARSQQMMVLNQQVLERIKPSVDKERDAFVNWLRSVINDPDHDVWRRCQQQIMTYGGAANNRSWRLEALSTTDHDVWRRCQQQIMTSRGVANNRSAIHYKYIAENDRLKRQQILPATNPRIPSLSKQSSTSLQGSSQTCSAMWQPPPSQWPNQPSSSVSVW